MKDTTRKAIKAEIEANEGGMIAAIENVPEYHQRVTIVSFDKLPSMRPAILRSIAAFAEDLSSMGEDLTVSMSGIHRRATAEELERAAIEQVYWADRERWENVDNNG
jgi:hypothetical protein